MGEVWKARDTRLNRDVAIKTSHGQFNARFEREARAVAALNHPNICHLYDVGPDYLVMELVDGQNLRGPLPPDEVLKIAGQIASALEAAHEKGIIHRDLKPGNIRITPDGVVKVLDFGLALMPAAELGDPGDPENTPTVLITEHTQAGVALGTPAYMSPEQARGKVTDKRTDIWAFGVVLYELFTGRRLFEGVTKSDTIAAVLTTAPDLSLAPLTARRLLRSCLEKDPKQRLRDIGDWRKLLDDPPAPPSDLKAPRRQGAVIAALLGAAFAGALLTFAMLRPTRIEPAAPEPVYRRLTDDNGLNDYPALSRDGKLIAYASDRAGAGNLDIWLQQIGGREAIQLTNQPDDETDPSFSPDSTRVAYRSERNGGGIYTMQTLGGDPTLLAAGGRNPRYSPDGKWIAYWTGRSEGSFAPGSSHVFIVDANGGQPRAIHPEMAVAEFPIWSPRGDALLVLGWTSSAADSEDFWMLPIGAGGVIRTGAVPRFKANGWRTFQIGLRVEPAALDWIDTGGDRLLSATIDGDSANLWETRLDKKGAILEAPHRLTRGPGRQAHATWAITDTAERLAFADESVNYDIWTAPLPAGGTAHVDNATRLTDSIATEWAPSLSADGKQMLFIARRSGSWAAVLRDIATGRDRELTSSPALLVNAVISGDGSHAVWTTSDLSMYSMPLAGSQASGQTDKLCTHCGTVLSLSSDGRYAAYEPVANEDLMLMDSVDHRAIQLAPRPSPNAILSGTQLSPDGRWVAFHSIDHATRTTQLWIARMDLSHPAPAQSWLAISDGKTSAQDPSWSPDGDVLYFTSERDGFRCYWGQHLDPAAKTPVGDPFPVGHFHSARLTLRGASSSGYLTRLSAARGRVVFAMAEVRGSIWLEEKPRAR